MIVLEAVKEAVTTVLLGPPGLQRMCTHPEFAALPSYEDVPGERVARTCQICNGQCA